MTIEIEPVAGVVVVRAGGAVLGESRKALEVREPGRDPAIYLPREDFVTAFLDPSPTEAMCPVKGRATYYHLVVKSGEIANAAWSYEAPNDAASAIAGHLAFDPAKVTVERLGGR